MLFFEPEKLDEVSNRIPPTSQSAGGGERERRRERERHGERAGGRKREVHCFNEGRRGVPYKGRIHYKGKSLRKGNTL